MKDLLERIRNGTSLPCLSPVAMKVVELASDEMCSAEVMAGWIERDPSLAVRVLRLANSALFATRHPASTVKEAIFRVGAERLRIMALSLSLRETFPMGRVGPMDYGLFWRSSLYQALLSKSIASKLGTCNPEEAFLAGLCLEIGLLILVDLFIKGKDEDVEIDQHRTESLLSWEQDRYGIDHRQIGEVALRAWRFPESIVACQRVPTSEDRRARPGSLPHVCDAGRILAGLICHKSAELDSTLGRVEEDLGLSQETIHSMLGSAFDQVEGIAEILAVEVDSEKDIIELLEKANRSLTRFLQGASSPGRGAPMSALPCFETLRQGTAERAAVAETLEAVSHEIRNPLVAVGGLARRLSRSLDPGSPGGRFARCILDEVVRLEQAMAEIARMAGTG